MYNQILATLLVWPRFLFRLHFQDFTLLLLFNDQITMRFVLLTLRIGSLFYERTMASSSSHLLSKTSLTVNSSEKVLFDCIFFEK